MSNLMKIGKVYSTVGGYRTLITGKEVMLSGATLYSGIVYSDEDECSVYYNENGFCLICENANWELGIPGILDLVMNNSEIDEAYSTQTKCCNDCKCEEAAGPAESTDEDFNYYSIEVSVKESHLVWATSLENAINMFNDGKGTEDYEIIAAYKNNETK